MIDRKDSASQQWARLGEPADTQPRPYRRLALIVMILGATMVALSGLCSTLVIMAPALAPADTAPVPGAYYGGIVAIAIAFGALGVLPGLSLLTTGKLMRTQPPHIIHGIIMIVFALPTAFIGLIISDIREPVFAWGGTIMAIGSVLTFFGGIWVLIAALARKADIKVMGVDGRKVPIKQALAGWGQSASQAMTAQTLGIDHPGLRKTAHILNIIMLVILALGAIFTAWLAITEPDNIIAIFLICGTGMGIIGLVAFAMRRHVKYGPNLMSEIITFLFGALVLLAGGLGLIFIGWALWSVVVRKQAQD